MSIMDFLRRNRGRHAACSGCHWHVTVTGFRCCACRASVSSRKDRPENTGECRLDRNTPPPPSIAGQQRNRGSDDDMYVWIGELTSPDEETVALPTTGRRRLKGRSAVNKARSGRTAT